MNTETKTVKTAKPGKVPRTFRKVMSVERWNKRWFRYIEQENDRSFFRSCFTESQGSMLGLAPADKAQAKRMKRLCKAIVANRGVFKAGPILAAAILVVGIAVFGLFFMNPLLEKAAELGLQAAFGAKAEVDGLRFSPFGMSFSMDHVAVADREEPMTNLFETGRLALAISPAAVFRGKLYIREATADSISVGTPRTVSGALPDKPASAKKAAEPAPDAPPLVDFKKFDAQALLEQEKAKLASPVAYAQATASYIEASARWKDRAAASSEAVENLQAQTKTVLAIDPKAITSVEAAAAAIASVKSALGSVGTVVAEAKAVASGVGDDTKAAAALLAAARAALPADIRYLVSLVDPKSGAAMAALEPQVKAMLSSQAKQYLYYAQRAWTILSGLADKVPSGKAAAKKPARVVARGRDVYFPSTAYPRFRLGRLSSSFKDDDKAWDIVLSEISTEPALVPAPATLSLALAVGSSAFKADAKLDLRGQPAWSAALDGRGFGVQLGSALASLGLEGLQGSLAGSGTARGSSPDDFSMGLVLELSKASVAKPEGTFGSAFAQALAKTESLQADVGFVRAAGSDDTFTLTTNIDELVGQAISALAKQYADKAKAQVEKAMRDYAAKELEGKVSTQELDALAALIRGDEGAAGGIKAALDKKLADLEARAKELGAGALQGLGIPSIPGIPSTGKP